MFSLLDRFCRYVRVDTKAVEGASTYPSSPGQWTLARQLVEELRSIGVQDVTLSDHAIIMGTIPATVKHAAPVIAWFAHMDTSPEFSGQNVQPQIHRNYQGGDIPLPGDPHRIIRVAENPELNHLHGCTIITTDGTTLLGADNKAGIAVIMATAEYLLKHPEIPHGPIRICFTCDEEIGHGVDHVDLKALGAVVGYTLDGMGQAELEGETFSADKAVVTITGVNIHPSIAKGKMVSAIRLAAKFLEALPQDKLQPELTEGREGFLHPVVIEGGVPEVKIMFILRDFHTPTLATHAALLREIGANLTKRYPQARIEVKVEKQYRNMADGLKKEPRAMALAEQAMRRAGLQPVFKSLRGGTDGSRLTELGLPTPNLSTGEHNPHSPLEWTALEEMETACKVLVELAQVWGEMKG
jgi:tripeptide aminopeptidase